VKTKILLLASLAATTLLLVSITNTVKADIISSRWLGYAYSDQDSFHRASVIAYEFNTTAILDITVFNDYVADKPVNISAVKVGFDWGQNYTSSQTSINNPYVIPWHESRVITVSFKIPSQTEVSNLYMYSYKVYLEHVNSTTGAKKIIGSETMFGGTNFVVYSADQVEAQKTKIIVQGIQAMTSPSDFNSTKARLLWMKAENETFVAGMLYGKGDFAGAKNHYMTALSLTNQALAAEEAKGGGFDDAQVRVLQAQANSLEASANYLNGLSNMWVLIGVAAVLFALGYIIRGLGALRKPPVAST